MPIHTEPYDEKDDQRVFYVLMGWGAMILIILIIALR